jgi:hypothetical protein
MVKGDRVQLQQVIMDLILNAVQAMDGVTDRPKDLTIATERDEDDHLRFVIRDAGVSFDPPPRSSSKDERYRRLVPTSHLRTEQWIRGTGSMAFLIKRIYEALGSGC